MPVDPRADAVCGLADVDRNFVEIAKHVAADLAGERANRTPPESQINGHSFYAAAFVQSCANFCDATSGSSRWRAKCLTTGTQTPSPAMWYASL